VKHGYVYFALLLTVSLMALMVLRAGALSPAAVGILSNPVGGGVKTTGIVVITVDSKPIQVPGTVFYWMPGETHDLAALSPIAAGTGVQFVFDSWSDGGDQSHTFTVPADSNGKYIQVVAYYKVQFLLTVETLPAQLSPQPTANPGSASGWYDEGTFVTLAAPAIARGSITGNSYTFLCWKINGGPATPNPTTILMDLPKTAVAEAGNPAGDINGDGVTNVNDFAITAKNYGAAIGEPNYLSQCDLNENGRIDLVDLAAEAILI
jgi:hypothetical protein